MFQLKVRWKGKVIDLTDINERTTFVDLQRSLTTTCRVAKKNQKIMCGIVAICVLVALYKSRHNLTLPSGFPPRPIQYPPGTLIATGERSVHVDIVVVIVDRCSFVCCRRFVL